MTVTDNTVSCPNCGATATVGTEPQDTDCPDDECPVNSFDGQRLLNPDPDRYTPEKEVYEQKDWLYEQYWGQLKSASEVAEAGDTNHTQILNQMESHGIPRRDPDYTRSNCVSAFRGFYNGGPTQGDGESSQQFDPEYEPDHSEDFTFTHWKGVGD